MFGNSQAPPSYCPFRQKQGALPHRRQLTAQQWCSQPALLPHRRQLTAQQWCSQPALPAKRSSDPAPSCAALGGVPVLAPVVDVDDCQTVPTMTMTLANDDDDPNDDSCAWFEKEPLRVNKPAVAAVDAQRVRSQKESLMSRRCCAVRLRSRAVGRRPLGSREAARHAGAQ